MEIIIHYSEKRETTGARVPRDVFLTVTSVHININLNNFDYGIRNNLIRVFGNNNRISTSY